MHWLKLYHIFCNISPMAHTCDVIVTTCIDFRFQGFIDKFIEEKFGNNNHDRVAWAGGVKDWDNVLNQIKISKRLHDIKEVVLINHEDCGAYGELGTPEKHAEDLKTAYGAIKNELSDVEIKTFYAKLDGSFEEIS